MMTSSIGIGVAIFARGRMRGEVARDEGDFRVGRCVLGGLQFLARGRQGRAHVGQQRVAH